MQYFFRILILFFSFTSLGLCTPSQTLTSYQKAIVKASKKNLPSVELEKLDIDDHNNLSLVSFTKHHYNTGSHITPYEIWTIQRKALVNWCQNSFNPSAKHLWQLLGMPVVDQSNWHLIDIKTSHRQAQSTPGGDLENGVFRPCFSSDAIDERHCTYQASSDSNYNLWLKHKVEGSFTPNGYPWTGLGYTYNWNQKDHQVLGPSEFVIAPQTPIEIVEHISIHDFCARAKAKKRNPKQ